MQQWEFAVIVNENRVFSVSIHPSCQIKDADFRNFLSAFETRYEKMNEPFLLTFDVHHAEVNAFQAMKMVLMIAATFVRLQKVTKDFLVGTVINMNTAPQDMMKTFQNHYKPLKPFKIVYDRVQFERAQDEMRNLPNSASANCVGRGD